MSENNETAPRTYVVLELVGEHLVDDAEQDWRFMERLQARNAEHAKKLVFIKRYGEDSDDRPMLVAVPERNWQPEPVGNRVRRSVSVG